MEEKLTFYTEDGEEVSFFILEETKISGVNYILVTESEEEEADAYIFKDTSNAESTDAVYEAVEDEDELEAVWKVFAELLEDVEFQG